MNVCPEHVGVLASRYLPLALGLVLMGVLVKAAEAQGWPHYAVIPLQDDPDQTWGWVHDINDRGVVTGELKRSADDHIDCIVWSPDSGLHFLPEIRGSSRQSGAEAINNSGAICGYRRVPDGIRHAIEGFVADQHGVRYVSPERGFDILVFFGIDEDGTAAGIMSGPEGYKAITWTRTGGLKALPSNFGNGARANCIADGIVGGTFDDGNGRAACLWVNDRPQILEMPDGVFDGFVLSICRKAGTSATYYVLGAGWYGDFIGEGILWELTRDGDLVNVESMTEIHSRMGYDVYPAQVNENGVVVGFDEYDLHGNGTAFAYQDGELVWLREYLDPDSAMNWDLYQLTAINRFGVMSGAASNSLFQSEIVLTIPLELGLSHVEPGVAGKINEVKVIHGDPGSGVSLYALSGEGGYASIPGCGGIGLLGEHARLLQRGSFGVDGVAVWHGRIPVSYQGRELRLQAVARSSCKVSQVVTQTLE